LREDFLFLSFAGLISFLAMDKIPLRAFHLGHPITVYSVAGDERDWGCEAICSSVSAGRGARLPFAFKVWFFPLLPASQPRWGLPERPTGFLLEEKSLFFSSCENHYLFAFLLLLELSPSTALRFTIRLGKMLVRFSWVLPPDEANSGMNSLSGGTVINLLCRRNSTGNSRERGARSFPSGHFFPRNPIPRRRHLPTETPPCVQCKWSVPSVQPFGGARHFFPHPFYVRFCSRREHCERVFLFQSVSTGARSPPLLRRCSLWSWLTFFGSLPTVA